MGIARSGKIGYFYKLCEVIFYDLEEKKSEIKVLMFLSSCS